MRSSKFFLAVFLLLINNLTEGHDWGRYWCFGDSAGINFSDPNSPITFTSFMDNPRAITSIGDSINGLLMYAHSFYWPLWISGYDKTSVVRNSNHQIMINGDSLAGDVNNGLTFINKPGSDSIFYLFQNNSSLSSGRLYYSLIDPYFGGIGKVLIKNQILPLADTALQMGVLAIKHANGRDWWIIVRNWYNSNRFNVFLVLPDTIEGPFEHNIGRTNGGDVGSMAVSKNGDKIALAGFSDVVEVYDFDRCSGQIYNPIFISTIIAPQLFGCEFSPDGNLLYVSSTKILTDDTLKIFQVDLTAPNPGATKQVIYSSPDPASGGLLKRGPDDKIYFSCLDLCGWPYPNNCRTQYNENLSVINNPNVYGLGCNFSKFSFNLGGKRTYWDLPNIPNFNLGEISGSACDSLTNNIKQNDPVISFNIYPNPCRDKLNIISSNNLNKNFRLYDSRLRLLYQTELKGSFNTIDISKFNNGIYFVRIGEKFSRKVIIQK